MQYKSHEVVGNARFHQKAVFARIGQLVEQQEDEEGCCVLNYLLTKNPSHLIYDKKKFRDPQYQHELRQQVLSLVAQIKFSVRLLQLFADREGHFLQRMGRSEVEEWMTARPPPPRGPMSEMLSWENLEYALGNGGLYLRKSESRDTKRHIYNLVSPGKRHVARMLLSLEGLGNVEATRWDTPLAVPGEWKLRIGCVDPGFTEWAAIIFIRSDKGKRVCHTNTHELPPTWPAVADAYDAESYETTETSQPPFDLPPSEPTKTPILFVKKEME